MDGHRLLQRARQGDLAAFNRLIAAYEALVYSQASYLLAEPRLAEAAAQAAFQAAYQELSTFRGSEAGLKLWLLQRVTDICLDASRGRPGGAASGGHTADPGVALRRGLLRLAPEARAAVVLVDIQGLDYAEAAAVLRTSAGTLARRLAHGRLGLSRFLKQTGLEHRLSTVV